MPEIKNTFLAGKMNKSLDTRLVPEGEYIDALNVQITKSDVGNVGVIQNVKGNEVITSVTPAGANPSTIGSFFDEKNNRVFWFVTDNGANNYIYMRDIDNTTSYTLVSGAFLNFNSANKITGVNILEDLLFWTDNRNQPRRINIETAIGDSTYYNSEVKISVAKYAPWKSPDVYAASYEESVKSKRIEEEFVRFAYRYKFKDNEYSVLSPFSPIVFKMESNVIDTVSTYYNTSDLRQIGASTEIPNMVNSLNQVTLRIPVPQNPKEGYDIEKIDILYKESDSNAIRVIETINTSSNNTSGYEEYIYKSTNFKATLPEDQLTRVFDNVPYKALAQEVAGNRVIYGNLTMKKDLPNILFRVANSAKTASSTKYEQHSVKQRRAYDVGIVLSDIFGRTSPVITSKYSSIYVGAKDENFDNSTWNGDSLKIIFESITDTDETLYSVDNPLGWYSYKVVVKQREQEYYNVYTPGAFYYNSGFKSYFVLHGDNVNKIPRTSEGVDAQDLFSSSNTRIYPKVLNISSGVGDTFERSYKNSSFGLLDVTDIGNLSDYNLTSTAYVYESSKDHLVASIPNIVGTVYGSLLSGGDFACFETEPFESSLDIYYETPTSGLLSDVVSNIGDLELNDTTPISLSKTTIDTTFDFSEGLTSGQKISGLYAVDQSGDPISGYLVSFQITSQPVSERFGVRFNESEGEWEIYMKTPFVYSSSSTNTIGISITFLDDVYTGYSLVGTPTDVIPSISVSGTNLTYSVQDSNNNDIGSGTLGVVTEDSLVMKLYAVNGSASKTGKRNNLTFDAQIRDLSINQVSFSPVSTYTTGGVAVVNYIEIINNKDIGTLQPDGTYQLIDAPGTAILNYHGTTAFTSSFINAGHIFEIQFKANDTIADSEWSETVTITVTGDPSLRIGGTDNILYYAPASTFDYSWQACADSVGSANWTQVSRYYSSAAPNDPFVVAEGANVPGKMYNDLALSISGSSGWYKRTDTGVVGYYFDSRPNDPAISPWFYETPAYCATLTVEDSEAAASYDNPKDTTTTTDTTDTTEEEAPTGGIP